ncbi:hypothetical protein [Paraclostridium sordellii]|uniref:hypothetical protein n=1 Tax=Paraclostridium sordellii TaxID=1505 RepID=UPI001A9A36D1|nr:hypothetical protein [Paeniclostridium sordellii]
MMTSRSLDYTWYNNFDDYAYGNGCKVTEDWPMGKIYNIDLTVNKSYDIGGNWSLKVKKDGTDKSWVHLMCGDVSVYSEPMELRYYRPASNVKFSLIGGMRAGHFVVALCCYCATSHYWEVPLSSDIADFLDGHSMLDKWNVSGDMNVDALEHDNSICVYPPSNVDNLLKGHEYDVTGPSALSWENTGGLSPGKVFTFPNDIGMGLGDNIGIGDDVGGHAGSHAGSHAGTDAGSHAGSHAGTSEGAGEHAGSHAGTAEGDIADSLPATRTGVMDWVTDMVVPADTYFTDKVAELSSTMQKTFPFADFTKFNNLCINGIPPASIPIEVMGVKAFAFNTKYVNSIVGWLRPLVSAFMGICLIYFNYRQFYKLIRGVDLNGIAGGGPSHSPSAGLEPPGTISPSTNLEHSTSSGGERQIAWQVRDVTPSRGWETKTKYKD